MCMAGPGSHRVAFAVARHDPVERCPRKLCQQMAVERASDVQPAFLGLLSRKPSSAMLTALDPPHAPSFGSPRPCLAQLLFDLQLTGMWRIVHKENPTRGRCIRVVITSRQWPHFGPLSSTSNHFTSALPFLQSTPIQYLDHPRVTPMGVPYRTLPRIT